jgi:predicted transcriptional regulator
MVFLHVDIGELAIMQDARGQSYEVQCIQLKTMLRGNVMSATPLPATIPVTVRLPAALVAKLDALAEATERSRTYWVQEALEDVIERELWQVRAVEEAIADDDAHPDEGMTAAEFETWMIENGLTTRETLDRAATKR